MTVGEWIAGARARLQAAGVAAPQLEAQILVGHVLLVDRVFLLAHPETEFPDLAGEALLMRRLAGEPLAYIVGWREFYGRRFKVSPAVLVPRHETEHLIEAALDYGPPAASVLDIGTGSGIIAVTLGLERPAWQVSAVDISQDALEVAKANAYELGARVDFQLSDLFENVSGHYYLIVSNPPYVGESDPLPNEVRDFEPHTALFAGENGLAIYRRLAEEAPPFLKPGGKLLLELGFGQLPEVQEIFESNGWRMIQAINDLALIPRVVVFERTASD